MNSELFLSHSVKFFCSLKASLPFAAFPIVVHFFLWKMMKRDDALIDVINFSCWLKSHVHWSVNCNKFHFKSRSSFVVVYQPQSPLICNQLRDILRALSIIKQSVNLNPNANINLNKSLTVKLVGRINACLASCRPESIPNKPSGSKNWKFVHRLLRWHS